MKKVIKTATVKRYHQEKDGTLKYLGTFTYKYLEEVQPEERTRVMAMDENLLAVANARRRTWESAFEKLVDAACEEGGAI